MFNQTQGVFFLTLFTLGTVLVYTLFRKVWKRQITAGPAPVQQKGPSSTPQAIPKSDPQTRNLPQVTSKPKQPTPKEAPAKEHITPGGDEVPAEQINAESERLKGLGNDAIRTKDYLSALKYYTDAILLQPTAILFGNRSLVHANLQNFNAALEDANKSIELDANYVRAYQRKISALMGLSRIEDAHPVAVLALKLEPGNTVIQKLRDDLEKSLEKITPKRPVEVIDEDDLVQRTESQVTQEEPPHPTYAEVLQTPPAVEESGLPALEPVVEPELESSRFVLADLPEPTPEPQESVRLVNQAEFEKLSRNDFPFAKMLGKSELHAGDLLGLDELVKDVEEQMKREALHTPEEAPEEWPALPTEEAQPQQPEKVIDEPEDLPVKIEEVPSENDNEEDEEPLEDAQEKPEPEAEEDSRLYDFSNAAEAPSSDLYEFDESAQVPEPQQESAETHLYDFDQKPESESEPVDDAPVIEELVEASPVVVEVQPEVEEPESVVVPEEETQVEDEIVVEDEPLIEEPESVVDEEETQEVDEIVVEELPSAFEDDVVVEELSSVVVEEEEAAEEEKETSEEPTVVEPTWSEVVQEAIVQEEEEEKEVLEESPLEDEQATPAEEILANLPEFVSEPEPSVRTVSEEEFEAQKFGEQNEEHAAEPESALPPLDDEEEWPSL